MSFNLCGGAQVRPSWVKPLPAFRIADNLYYVGSQDLAAYLVTTSAGNILINANLPSSPSQIRASVEQLGFRWGDTKILLTGQAHYDHAGGFAEVLRQTHARSMVMEYDAEDSKRFAALVKKNNRKRLAKRILKRTLFIIWMFALVSTVIGIFFVPSAIKNYWPKND